MGEAVYPLSSDDSPTLLRLEDIGKRWGSNVILDGIDLALRAGSVTGLAGDNGAGKTTLLRIACGILVPDRGSVSFRGTDIERRPTAYHREIGLLPAGDRGLYARLTVQQNLAFWGGLAGLSRGERERRIAGVLGEFALGELAHRRVDRLSTGQRQRVRLAGTFLHEPLIVFLDEPRTSLDEVGVSLLARALDRLTVRGGAALWASHESNEPLASEVWRLDEGRLHSVRPPSPESTADLRVFAS
jgi:ABC-type multidrug transport system ATPase subunit